MVGSILNLRHLISTQLYLAIGSAVGLTIAASLVGLFSFNNLGEAQGRVNDDTVPELTAAFKVAQSTASLTDAAPRIANANSFQDLAGIASSVEESHGSLLEELSELRSEEEHTAIFVGIEANIDNLLSNIDDIRELRGTHFQLESRLEFLRLELAEIREQLDGLLVSEVDDQLFFTMTGYRTLQDPPVPIDEHFSSDQLARYRLLADLHAQSDSSTLLLESAFSISAAALLEPLAESFESSSGEILRIQTAMGESEVQQELDPLLDRLVELGIGGQGVFATLDESLRLAEQQQLLAAENRGITVSLVSQVDGLVDAANVRAAEATLASEEAISTGQFLLLSISGISVGGAILIAWLFVGRSLLRRLATLSTWMRRMASGDLEAQVEIKGRDEVANMAAALEVFRQHALEVQRLNLVEELADELQGKNEQLEGALSELNRAQDQIVMREKLAALGELTAGVAHEIRNPLNFVKNFSEVSTELLEELHEVLEDAGDSIPQKNRDEIQDISEDLSSNLERIGSHTARANRIVHDMLMMGRDTAEWQIVDINNLVDEYSRLAFHSARATDPDFQLDLQTTLGDNVGELEAIPQDLGRVFLNIVSNACYATDEKRKQIMDSGGDYMPGVFINTSRDDENITINIRDNANGMPAEVVEKIFNPFFTTKPSGQGTGLGLAISNDIVREHGGSINVVSTPGEGTEMTIRLPLVNAARAAEASEHTNDAGDGDGDADDEGAVAVAVADAGEDDDDDGESEAEDRPSQS